MRDRNKLDHHMKGNWKGWVWVEGVKFVIGLYWMRKESILIKGGKLKE